mmetsp:Transcript_53230/g.64181  ORF Transcript_53230/g.64181 Transcript_53230/m.64181 type:complete len:110 (-) Transcript_53230:19-348(-)
MENFHRRRHRSCCLSYFVVVERNVTVRAVFGCHNDGEDFGSEWSLKDELVVLFVVASSGGVVGYVAPVPSADTERKLFLTYESCAFDNVLSTIFRFQFCFQTGILIRFI